MLQLPWAAVTVILGTMAMIASLAVWVLNVRIKAFEHKIAKMLAETREQIVKDMDGTYVRKDVFEGRVRPIERVTEQFH